MDIPAPPLDTPHVLKVARTDLAGPDSAVLPFVVVNITPALPKAGTQPDILPGSRTSSLAEAELVATDGEEVYALTLTSSILHSARASTYPGTPDNWLVDLAHLLFETSLPAGDPSLELVASVKNQILSLTLRKHIGGITQRLGQLALGQSASEDGADVLAWAAAAADWAAHHRRSAAALQAQLANRAATIATLRRDLDDLVARQVQKEAVILNRFTLLLNEKKAFIRHRLPEFAASSAHAPVLSPVVSSIPPPASLSAAPALPESPPSPPPPPPAATRGSGRGRARARARARATTTTRQSARVPRRKRAPTSSPERPAEPEPEPEPEPGAESEPGTETDVDQRTDSDESIAQTDLRDGELSDDPAPISQPAPRTARQRQTQKNKQAQKRMQRQESASASETEAGDNDNDNDNDIEMDSPAPASDAPALPLAQPEAGGASLVFIPPRRALPFQRKTQKGTTAAAAAAGATTSTGGGQESSTDDEL